MATKAVTVYLVKKENNTASVCLGKKKREGYAHGKWNGFGGKLEAGEDFIAACVREVNEETGVSIKGENLTELGRLKYQEPQGDWVVRVFVCETWIGEPSESDEMYPKWFAFEEIPYTEMWANDKLWLPRVLAGQRVEMDFVNDENGKVISIIDKTSK